MGPGRGSGAGSLVAYSLGITDLDPLRYDLLFERFLNPERVSMPDFDIDFCQDGRDRVIDYVKEKYGARGGVADRHLRHHGGARRWCATSAACWTCPTAMCDRIAKLIPLRARACTLDEGASTIEPQLDERSMQERGGGARAAGAGAELEGLTRNVGMHAGGVLIAPGKLTDFCPLYCAEGATAW